MDLLEAGKRNEAVDVRHPWEQARLAFLKKLMKKYVPLSPGSLVIDIGCGDTYVVENLAAAYPASVFYAVDIAFTDEMIRQYTGRLRVKNVKLFGSLGEIPGGTASSLIILADVIEHIEDDQTFVSCLLAEPFIDEGTYFLITVPAYQSLFCSHDVFLGHYRRYTNKLLRANMSVAGLQVKHCGYFFFSLVPFRMLQVLKERLLGAKKEHASTGLVTWRGGRLISSVFRGVLSVDAGLLLFMNRLGLTFPGLANYAVCQKFAS